jgi:hypothetical protein
MGKTVTVGIPSWVDEDEFRRIVDMFVKRLEGRSQWRSLGGGSA